MTDSKSLLSNSVLRKIASFLTLSLLVVLSSSCAPRGETNSLDEILADSKQRFRLAQQSASGSSQDFEQIALVLEGISSALSSLESNASDGTSSKKVVEGLSGLINKAGYPQRPGMGELLKQFRSLSSKIDSGEKIAPNLAQLLSARTYHALASELESTKFQLS